MATLKKNKKRRRRPMESAVIVVRGGVADLAGCSKNVLVDIIDFDNLEGGDTFPLKAWHKKHLCPDAIQEIEELNTKNTQET